MPNVRAMAQLSRPYQIALATLGLFAVVWFAALHRPGASSSSSSSAPSAPTAASSSPANPSTGTSSVYHGSAPGVEGLTRDIAKAHGAVTQSQTNAQQLQSKSAAASNEATPSTSVPSSTKTSSPSKSSAKSSTKAQTHVSSANAKHAVNIKIQNKVASNLAALKKELGQGKVAMLLFWNPKASDDVAVHSQLMIAGHKLGGKVAVHDALASQVGAFGSVTQNVQIYQTPTIMLINKHGLATTLTGFTDAFSIEQAVNEVEHQSQHS
jgi:hypothetical protein